MKVIYSDQKIPHTTKLTVFLAGPTFRSEAGSDITKPDSWRKEALSILEELNFNGTVLIPEVSTGEFKNEYDDQVEWEEEGLNVSDLIVFWIPRNIHSLPGLTTNDEWGYWKGVAPEKLVLGCPDNAEKVRYQKYYADKYNIPTFNTLQQTLEHVIDKFNSFIKKGYDFTRTGVERFIPLEIWNSETFEEWYTNQLNMENSLHGAKVLWKYYVGPDNNILFLWSMWVKVWIKAEKRYKDNECIVSRFNLSSVVMYHINKDNIWNSEIVLVKEFRSPVNNGHLYVYENPGGSSFSTKDPKEVIIKEIKEETGIDVNPERLEFFGRRQLASTLSIHKNALFGLQLTKKEMNVVRDAVKGQVFGNTSETEMTYIDIRTLDYVLEQETVDHAQVGMILEVIGRKIKGHSPNI